MDIFLNQLIQFYSNNAANLHQFTQYAALTHTIEIPDYCDVTSSPYVHPRARYQWTAMISESCCGYYFPSKRLNIEHNWPAMQSIGCNNFASRHLCKFGAISYHIDLPSFIRRLSAQHIRHVIGYKRTRYRPTVFSCPSIDVHVIGITLLSITWFLEWPLLGSTAGTCWPEVLRGSSKRSSVVSSCFH